LERLFLNNTKITLTGAEMLFDSLKHNSHLFELDLSDNDLSGQNINKIQILLWTNRELRKLNLANCMLGKEAAQAIG
jgi:Ran GTPase-activating protein (RanGAP) involved in mRNA processing and transport